MRRAQKNAPAASIVEGDQIFRTTKDRGDVMMVVKSARTAMHGEAEVFVWRGDVYQLAGSGAGPNANFLGDITGLSVGTAECKMPTDGQVTKGVPVDEADYEF